MWRSRTGQRVVVRYRPDGGDLTDAVGDLISVDADLHVRTRQGTIVIPAERVVAGRVVPPKPTRPGPPHLVISITDLQNVMALHWRAPESERRGGWLLRAAGGFTGRANSALAVSDPAHDPAHSLADVSAWYAERGLPAKVTLAVAVPGGAPDDAGPASAARAMCRAAGWSVIDGASALTLTAPTKAVRDLGRLPEGLTLDLADTPDEQWLAGYRYRGQDLPAEAFPLLLSAPEQVFVSIRDAGRTLAVARGSLGGGWAGLTAVDVAPEGRRRGLGTVLLGAVASWAARSGASSTYLQVADTNAAARRLYDGAGFALHHRYDYLQAPGTLP
jgi:GNAT superfamily N-acetyltransferase